jgi:formylglycine-generating enzyme required for sulfatase activity/serine/threonine protein kinase
MSVPVALLKVIGKGVLNAVGGGVVGDVLFEALPEVAREVWAWWRKDHTPEQQRQEVEGLAQATPAEVREAVHEAVVAVAADKPPEVQRSLEIYLSQIPGAVRQSLRRPADPSGLSLPLALAFQEPDDILPLLPAHLPRFKAGDRPLAGIDWELVELLGVGGFGEVWKARNPHFDAVPPVALKFCLDPASKDRLLRHEAAILNQVMRQGKHPGIVALQHTYLSADPPCLEYEYVAGGDMTKLINEWRPLSQGPLRAERATRLLLELARIIGFAHRQNPAVVHRDLKPANILVQQNADGSLGLRVADFGIGGLVASQALAHTARHVSQGAFLVSALRGAHTPLYASPQQMRGLPADPRDDVYALSIIWYQLLTGNLVASRPSGSRWVQKLRDQGVPLPLLELLGECVEEDPADRPRDAAELAERLTALLAPAPIAVAPRPTSVDDLASQLQRGLKEANRANEEARRLADEQHDYAAAVQVLVRVPPHLRDLSLHIRLSQARDRVQELNEAVRAAVQATRLEGLRPLVEDLLRLQPRREDLRLLLAALPTTLVDLPRALTVSAGIKLVLIHPGAYLRGSHAGEMLRGSDEGPQRRIVITRPFYLGVVPIMQQQYEQVIGENPSHFTRNAGGSPLNPVEQISWNEAVAFCQRLSNLSVEKNAGQRYRLPTEAEWEYACRAGATLAFNGGETLSSTQANFDGGRPHGPAKPGPYLQRTSKVGSYPANAWGLHDMHGNVWEWCQDWYEENYYADSPEPDPRGPSHGTLRVLRGGSWNNSGHLCRSARRNKYAPDFKSDTIGFRIVLTVE